MTVDLPDAARAWVLVATGGTEIAEARGEPLHGGAVAASVQRLEVTVRRPDGMAATLALVRKTALPFEVTALRAAQVIRPAAPVIPELIASGTDAHGPWVITPYYEALKRPTDALPPVVFESLAALHAHMRRRHLDGVPLVDAGWWSHLCLDYCLPAVQARADAEPAREVDRAAQLLHLLAEDPIVPATLERLPRTLVHNDVHQGNVLVTDTSAVLIDWGSARFGPAMLDLANVTRPGTAHFEIYAQRWRAETGAPLDPDQVELGYRWADLQIPIQYLAWVTTTQPLSAVGDTLDRAETALRRLQET